MAIVVLVADRRHDVDPGRPDVARANPAGAATALHDLVAALGAGDERAASGLAPDGDADAGALLADVARNAQELPLTDLSARYVDEVGAVAADGSWTADVALTWRLDGYDAEPARSDVLVSFTSRGGTVAITGFGSDADAGGRRTPLWLQGPLAVVRRSNPDLLVLGDRPADELRATARRVAGGVAVVRRTLWDWDAPVVVEVPASASRLDEALGAAPGTYAGVAAVTAPVDGSARAGAPTHVFVNPDVSDGLRAAGAQVVMSHELAHLATGAARSTTEPWLVEGFADWVALRDVDLPDATSLGRAIALARRDGVPDQLPGVTELDTRAADLQAAYEQAWLACRLLAERLGPDGLVRLYRRVEAGEPLSAALRRSGVPDKALVRAWRRRLQDLAG